MKKLLAIILVFAAAICHSQQTNRTPLLRAYLQTQLDGNGKLATNFANPVSAQDLATKAYVDAGGGSGGAVVPGQSTTIRTNGSAYAVDITGTLTNDITGNATTATDADFATEATKSRGLLDTDSADAVTVTLTKIVATSGHDYLGGGSGLTNIPSLFFATVADMTNTPNVAAGVVAYVDSYHSNWYGGGMFKKEAGTATIDNGLVFTSPSGCWRRMMPPNWPTNAVLGEWFGLWPNNTGNLATDLADQSAALQAAIDATPKNNGVCYLPEFPVTIANSLIFTNWVGGYFGGRNPNVSAEFRYWPNNASLLNWNAPGGTMVKLHNSGRNTFANFGIDPRPPTSNAAYWTNSAALGIDVDMFDPHITTTTANFFNSLCILVRGTNVGFEGIRIAYTAGANCEFMSFNDSLFQGTGGGIGNYWMSVTNCGALYGIRVGGGATGAGANAFGLMMRNCNFSGWQYNVRSGTETNGAGSWDIANNKGTAAGVAAYFLNCVRPSYIRNVRDEGDRQFLVSPSTKPVILIGNTIASASLSVSNIAAVDAQNLIMDGNVWNLDSSHTTPSVTNSFTSSGWFVGRNNYFASTNDALLPSWKFGAGFESRGDFGTIAANNNIQLGPWKTPSATQTTNVVFQKFTDGTASGMELTLMPSNGNFSVGSPINNTHFGVYLTDLTKTSLQFGDSVIADRLKLLQGSGGNTSIETLKANTTASRITQSTNARVDVVSENGKSTLNWRSGYGEITGTNGIQLLRFDVDGQIWFPYPTNLNIGSSRIGMTHVAITNLLSLYTNESEALIPATPTRYGQVVLFNRGSVLSQKIATTNGALAWRDTNALATSVDIAPLANTNGPHLQAAHLKSFVFLDDIPTESGLPLGFVKILADRTLVYGNDGSQLTGLDASQLTAGLVSPPRLSATNSVPDGYVLSLDHGTNKWTAASGGSGGWTGNPNQFTGGSATNIKDGVLLTNAVNRVTAGQQLTLLASANGNSFTMDDSVNSYSFGGAGVTANSFSGVSANLSGLTASRIVVTDGSKNLASAADSSTSPINSAGTAATSFTGNGSGLTNLTYPPTALTLSDTNAALFPNMVSTLIVTTNVLFTNWPSMAVAGTWGRTVLTNAGAGVYKIFMPTNLMPHNLTNSIGCYSELSPTGTNWACYLTNGRKMVLSWYFEGANISSGEAYVRHW